MSYNYRQSYVPYLFIKLGMLLLLSFFVSQNAVYPQTTSANLSGVVVDSNGDVIPGVAVSILNLETALERKVTTDEDGKYNFQLLPPGTYSITAQRDGFAPVEIRNITLNVNDQRALRVELQVGNVAGSVTVNNEPSLINESAAQATTIDRTFVENLPLNGRSFQSLIQLSPGVVPTGGNSGGFSVNGQRPNANYFTVDGVSANVQSNVGSSTFIGATDTSLNGQAASGALPGLSTLGTTNTIVSVDALEEFKIQTSTYSAEFGRQPGGQVQLLTRSGGSRFHGSIYDYVRNEAFDANNFFNNANGVEKAPLRQNQFGGTFSGPIYFPRFGEGGPALYNGKRTFFFFAYEGLRLLLPSSVNTLVPSLRLRAIAAPALKPLLNAFPLPTGEERKTSTGALSGGSPFVASYSNPKSADTYSLRLDHSLTDKVALFGRYNKALSANDTRLLSVLTGGKSDLLSLTLGSTQITKAFSNEIRFNYSRNEGTIQRQLDDFGGATVVDPSAFVSGFNGPGIRSGRINLSFLPNTGGQQIQVGDSLESYQRQINLVDTVSIPAGNHQLKFGFDYRRLMPSYEPAAFLQGITVTSEANVVAGRGSVSIQTRNAVEPRFDNYSFFAQDDWKATRRLTLSLGLRYEYNPAPYDANGLEPVVVRGIVGTDVSKATIAPPGTPFYEPFKTAFAPRVGAAYQLNDKSGRETVLRGGFGVFYDLGNGQTLGSFNNYPFLTSLSLGTVSLPLSPAQAQPLPFPPVTLPTTRGATAIDPDLKLPYTLQWNLGVEQSLGKDQALSVSYVASAGRDLIARRTLNSRVNGTGPTQSPNFGSVIIYTTNGPTSDYHSLQTQFKRRLSRGLQALMNYTWSHAIDTASSEVDTGTLDRGNSNFDVRHNFSAAVTYNIPTFGNNSFVRAFTRNWGVDSTVYLLSGQPIELSAGTAVIEDGITIFVRPDLVQGVPVWIEQAGVPGGRRINPAAFVNPPFNPGFNVNNCGGFNCFARQGTLARNAVYGPGIFQVNLGLRREFRLYEQLRMQFRAEAFNVFNRPHFGTYDTFLSSSTFGIPTQTLNTSLGGLSELYQLGGPRSLQFSLKLVF